MGEECRALLEPILQSCEENMDLGISRKSRQGKILGVVPLTDVHRILDLAIFGKEERPSALVVGKALSVGEVTEWPLA